MSIGEARLDAKGMRWLRTGHPWVFDGDVLSATGSPEDVFAVRGPEGQVLGHASYSPGSRIRLRWLALGTEFAGVERLFADRLEQAAQRRAPLLAETDAMRIVAAEADGLPGLIVDRYADVLVVQVGTAFMEAQRSQWLPWLVEYLRPTMVLARNDLRVRRLEGLGEESMLLHGDEREQLWVQESGLRMEVRPRVGQKTGLFLDQRPARARVRERARSGGGRWLDVCSYQGAFALAALSGGAESVLAIDVSASALAAAERAAAENGLAGLELRQGDAFEVLEELRQGGARFDGIVVDPPAFAKTRREAKPARRAYEKLNALAFSLLAPGGVCLSCSCSQHVGAPEFRAALVDAAARAGRRLRDLGRLGPALDHPILLGFPEGDYLKAHELEDAGLPG